MKISEEQKRAIKYLEKYTKWETYGERNLEKDIMTALNLIEKLQKENKKYKQFFDLMLRLDSDYFMNCGDEETIKLVDEILKLESE